MKGAFCRATRRLKASESGASPTPQEIASFLEATVAPLVHTKVRRTLLSIASALRKLDIEVGETFEALQARYDRALRKRGDMMIIRVGSNEGGSNAP